MRHIQYQPKFWYFILFFLTLVIGVMFSIYVSHAQDEEMRDNLITYTNTIEQSIDWKPFAATLNVNPNQIKASDLAQLELQLKNACKVNSECHFIYLLYQDNNQVKFLLDASPQPPSEISQLGEVFVEASAELKHVMNTRKPYVEGPVTDHWGTWVSTRVPVTSTIHTPNFVMLSIDVAATDWNRRVLKKTIVPVVTTLIFLGILIGFFYQNKVRDKLFSEQLHSTSQLNELANNDALTGLPNRRLLEDRMTQALKSAKRTQRIVAVFFIDLDNFKIINDTYGHAVGDELLKSVTARLIRLLREEDTVARIGGDEFIVLLPKLRVEQEAITTAEKVVAELAMPFTIAEHLLQIGASVGIVLYPRHDNDPYNLIKYADSAMYVAKRQGRNCYSVYTADHSESAN
ncbi:MAG: GGDEF domain-containing protein [Bacteroidia bacterium]|nr:GGDEF domain-containing protein [Methylotenera sp.]